MAVKLGRITWTPIEPLYKNANQLVTYGHVNGIRVLFVMGNEGGWHIGPSFDIRTTPRALKIVIDHRHPSVNSAKRAGRRLMETYLRLITEKENAE